MRGLANRFALMGGGKKLPYDRRVQWLQGDGKVYFNTGLNGNGKYLQFECDRIVMPYTGSYMSRSILGGYNYSQIYLNIIGSRDNSGTVPHFGINAVVSGTSISKNLTPYAGSREEVIFTGNKIDTEAGTIATGSSSASFTPFQLQSYILYIWHFGATTSQTVTGGMKLYFDGELVGEFIPCVKDGVGEYYDTVRGDFMPKVGTGTITIGPDVE